jgi:hypothetical protein
MLSAELPVFSLPTYSAIIFGGVPAAVITLGVSMNCMGSSLRLASYRDDLKILRIERDVLVRERFCIAFFEHDC